MANRNWRTNNNYQSYNQILTPVSYYPQPVTYSAERKNYGGRGGYREENYKRERKDFQSNRRERFSPIKRRSPYQGSHETRGSIHKQDSKKPHGHYEVKAPHLTFDIKELSPSSLKFRYPKMYIPSDFFHTRLNVQEAFPLYRPMKLGNHCEFQILGKEVEEVDEVLATLEEPVDADYKYSAKVMLMTTPSLPDLYKATNKGGLNRNVQFLVGNKGKNELMAFGGAWSSSLDGADPATDPQVLVRTAIRTCQSLTGIDLSRCKKWYKFLNIHYYRSTASNTTKDDENITEEEPLVETVTIFIPDIWSCVPSSDEWAEIRAQYENKLNSLLYPVEEEIKEDLVGKVEDIVEKVEEDNETLEEVKEILPEGTEPMEEVKNEIEEVNEKKEEIEESSSVDLNQMKVTELRAELATRGLETKGLKLQLVHRLQEAIDNEKKSAPAVILAAVAVSDVKEVSQVTETKYELPTVVERVSKLSEKEQKRLEKLYRINEKPSILVHSNKSDKSGARFECVLMSLDSLLQYRLEDQKDHSFEVSLFAEQFHEMVQRDAGFIIYKALMAMPDAVKECEAGTEPKKARLELMDGEPHQSHTTVGEPRRSKMMVDLELMFGFSMFDSDNSGYLRDHELESVLHSLGLNLSRSQAKKLVAKIASRKSGSIVYRDVVEREVVEGGPEDVASLKPTVVDIDRVVTMAQGNKAFFEEQDTEMLATRPEEMLLLDRLIAAETRRVDLQVQLTLLMDELKKVKTTQSGAGLVESHLRDNIKKIEDKLRVEKENGAKLCELAQVYNGLLKSARDHMEVSVSAINEQLEIERLSMEMAKKEEAERVKKEEEAERAQKKNEAGEEDDVVMVEVVPDDDEEEGSGATTSV